MISDYYNSSMSAMRLTNDFPSGRMIDVDDFYNVSSFLFYSLFGESIKDVLVSVGQFLFLQRSKNGNPPIKVSMKRKIIKSMIKPYFSNRISKIIVGRFDVDCDYIIGHDSDIATGRFSFE